MKEIVPWISDTVENLSNTDTERTEQSVRIIEVYMVFSRSSSSVRVVLSICLLF